MKQITIAIISRGIIGSFSMKNATIDVKKGYVYQNTIIRDKGARGAARFKSKKLV